MTKRLRLFKLNYLGVRNAQTYSGGPKFYIPPRRGPLPRLIKATTRGAK